MSIDRIETRSALLNGRGGSGLGTWTCGGSDFNGFSGLILCYQKLWNQSRLAALT